MKRVVVFGVALMGLANCFALAGDANDPLASKQGDWVCQGGGGQLGREALARKLGLPFWNREFRPKITMNVKGDRWTMVHPDGTVKGKMVGRKSAKLDEIDLTIDGKDDSRLLGLIVPLAGGSWGFCLNLPGKARPTDAASADLSYFWHAAK